MNTESWDNIMMEKSYCSSERWILELCHLPDDVKKKLVIGSVFLIDYEDSIT